MKQISTATLGGRRKVEIDGHGYTVRKMGAGESLALSQTQRRLLELGKKEPSALTDSETEEIEQLGSKFIDAITALFDDGEGGIKAKELVSSLSPDEIIAMQNVIWSDEPEKKPNEPNTTNS